MGMNPSLSDVAFLVWIVMNLYIQNQPRSSQNLKLWRDFKKILPIYCACLQYSSMPRHILTAKKGLPISCLFVYILCCFNINICTKKYYKFMFIYTQYLFLHMLVRNKHFIIQYAWCEHKNKFMFFFFNKQTEHNREWNEKKSRYLSIGIHVAAWRRGKWNEIPLQTYIHSNLILEVHNKVVESSRPIINPYYPVLPKGKCVISFKILVI